MPGSQAAALQKANVIQQTAPALAPNAPWIVLKFGGTSVSTRPRWDNIAAHRRRASRARPARADRRLGAVGHHRQAQGDRRIARRRRALRARARRDRRASRGDGARARTGVARRARSSGSTTRSARRRSASRDPATSPWQAEVLALGELMSTHARRFISFRHRRGHARDALARRARAPARAWRCRTRMRGAVIFRPPCRRRPIRHWRARSPRAATCSSRKASSRATRTARPSILGRGGSDTSAGYFGALLKARARRNLDRRARHVQRQSAPGARSARLLSRLDYEEAQEIATTGAKVLHPRCINPLREPACRWRSRTPNRPQLAGTEIGAAAADARAERQGDQLAQRHHADLDGNDRHVAAGRLPRRRVRATSSATACRSI